MEIFDEDGQPTRRIEVMKPMHRSVMVRPEGYMFFKPKRHAWLARLAWKLLRKLHALEPYGFREKVTTFAPHTAAASLLPELNAQLNALDLPGSKALVLMGTEDYIEACRDPELYALAFNFAVRGRTGYGGPVMPTVFHMPVIVEPTIRGVVVLPKAQFVSALSGRPMP